MSKLSVVIPIYNVEAFLVKCIESVLYPELPDYEIILVNDGSTDSSPVIAQSYAERYPELITLISTPNGGLGHARNVGIEAAKGEYLLFVDSDDYLTENAVPEMMETLEGGHDMVIFDMLTVNENDDTLQEMRGCSQLGELTLESCPLLINSPPNACNKIFRRSLFVDNNIYFPDRAWYEDVPTIPRLYLHTGSILSVRKSWYRYFVRSGSITNSHNEKRILEMIQGVDTTVNYYKSMGKYEQYETELVYLAFYNQFLTVCTRAAQINKNSPVIDELRNTFLASYPDFEKNEKVRAIPFKWKLLSKLICLRLYGAVAWIMKINNLVKRK